MLEDLSFLEEGEFTRITDLVRRTAQGLKSGDGAPIRAISQFVTGLALNEPKKEKEFRKRTASEIIKAEYVTGCTDIALVFIALARASGIPTVYVETIEQDPDPREIRIVSGHVFVDLKLNREFHPYEPKRGFVQGEGYIHGGRKYIEIGRGLDFSEVFLKEKGAYNPGAVRIDSIERLMGLKEMLLAQV